MKKLFLLVSFLMGCGEVLCETEDLPCAAIKDEYYLSFSDSGETDITISLRGRSYEPLCFAGDASVPMSASDIAKAQCLEAARRLLEVHRNYVFGTWVCVVLYDENGEIYNVSL